MWHRLTQTYARFTRIFILVSILGMLFAVALSLPAQDRRTAAGEEELPPDPMAGRIVFEETRCIKCHAIGGYGGSIGPDLGREKFFGGYYDLASRLWNHAPQMAIRSLSLGEEWSTLTTRELDELISFLFYLRYLGEPGNISRGKELFRTKGCIYCHPIGEEGSTEGIALERLKEFASPMYVAQSIWNHGPEIQQRMEALGIERPVFDDDEITHISAYMRELSRGQPTRIQYMSLGNPQTGARLFQSKGCAICHAVDDRSPSQGPRLTEIDRHRSGTAIAGSMWNHSHVMAQAMREEGLAWPTFEGSEMADLIAYLYFYDYLGIAGDDIAGRKVFESKQCIQCHGAGKPLALGQSIFLEKPTDLIRTMWNHVPYMHEETIAMNIAWPELTAREFQDLYAYLLKWTAGD